MYQTDRNHSFSHRLHQRSFNSLYERSLLYNACWEDPAIDREAMQLRAHDEILVITSAGCNALDYAIDGPRRVHAVDANPRQTALLDLKVAGIKSLAWSDFFAMFGQGVHQSMHHLYGKKLRPLLSQESRTFWDSRLHWWNGRGWRSSFYFHGLSGLVARLMHVYFSFRPRLHQALKAMFAAPDIEAQKQIFDKAVAPRLFPAPLRWVLNRQATMSLLGVPYEQGRMVEATHGAGIAGFIMQCIGEICCQLPLQDNYFWRCYLEGGYRPDCCPRYLSQTGFAELRAGKIDCINTATMTLTEYMREHKPQPSRFILLDHMDWMGEAFPDALGEEWTWIAKQAREDAQILFRSGSGKPEFLDRDLTIGNRQLKLSEHLDFDHHTAARLHQRDRVHTYASFHLAHLQTSLREAAISA